MNNKLPPTIQLPYRRKALAALISSSMLALQTTHATPVLEEVIVTSTKEMQNLQDIPQAITAFTTADIEKQGFVGIDEYAKKIPSLAFARREPGGTSVIFRGVASSGIQYGTNPSSSVYLDEQPVTAAGVNPNPRMIDIERLEALSGPQGTLFGDASQSGALRIITNKADPSGFSGWVEGEAGTVSGGENEGGISAMVNVPVTENMAIRLVGFSFEEAGYIDNVLQDSPPGDHSPGGTFDNRGFLKKDINSATEKGGRLALHWDINDNWLMDAMAVYQKTDRDGAGDINLDVGDLEQVRYSDEYSEDEWYQLGVTLEGDLGFAQAVISATYFDRETFYQADNTDYLNGFQDISDNYEANYAPGYDIMFYDFGSISGLYTFNGDPRGRASNEGEDERFSLEARLQFEGDDGDWNLIVGTFYNKRKSKTIFRSEVDNFTDSKAFYYLNNLACADFPVYESGPYTGARIPGGADSHPGYFACDQHSLNGRTPGSWDNTTNWFFGVYDDEATDYALFAEGNYDLNEDFTVTAGLRWYESNRDRDLFQGALAPLDRDPDRTLDYVNNDEQTDETETGVVGKFSIRYNFDYDKMAYFTYSEGFRSGGGNAVKNRSVLPRSFDGDFLLNHELGFKSTWMDNRLRFNIVGYYMIWEDIQIQVDDPQTNVFSTGVINFSEAEIWGAEIEALFAVTDGLELSINHANLRSTISKDETVLGPQGELVATVEEGTRLPITPNRKTSVGLEYNFQQQLLDMDPYIKIDYNYVGHSVNSIQGLGAAALKGEVILQDSYHTTDLKFGLQNDVWQASLAIENLDNKRAKQFYSSRWGPETRVSVNKPRTATLSLRYYF